MKDHTIFPMIKALLPFFPPGTQAQFRTFLRFRAITEALKQTEEEEEELLHACSFDSSNKAEKMMEALSPFLSSQDLETLDLIKNLFLMQELSNKSN